MLILSIELQVQVPHVKPMSYGKKFLHSMIDWDESGSVQQLQLSCAV